MNTGMNDDVSNTFKNIRKTAVINSELHRLNVDIAALQETRLAGQGFIKKRQYTFFGAESLLKNEESTELDLQ